ncbi:MAG: CAP domain-containing protein [Candidatus Melainabacteria bacterium]|nr:CAP domain-containing protein [Candidatus Melainabacteria bacterium]
MRIRNLAIFTLLSVGLLTQGLAARAEVNPGPFADKRQQLKTYLEKARATGFGTGPYDDALEKIEYDVKNGVAESEIDGQIKRLTKALSEQVQNRKTIKASGMGMGSTDPVALKKLRKSKQQIPVSQLESYMLTLVNKHRKENGIATIGTDGTLARCAREHADDMIKRKFFNHTNPDGLDGFKRAQKAGYKKGVRENIARTAMGGNGILEVEAADEGLMRSPGHKANILDPELKVVGIGIAYDPVTWQLRVCQLFGK